MEDEQGGSELLYTNIIRWNKSMRQAELNSTTQWNIDDIIHQISPT